jgi:hypothetical protein
MGCCLGLLLLGGAPRVALFLWWLTDSVRVTGVFHSWGRAIGTGAIPSFVWPLLGFFFLPWTTVAYVWVAPGGLSMIDWVILVIALVLDLGVHGGSGRESYARRRSS